MTEVMNKAQELAQAILKSEPFQNMKDAEDAVQADPEASAALAKMIEKRRAVEDLLATAGMDPNDLAKASTDMEEAEKSMNALEKIQKLKQARAVFSRMMDGVNQLLRLLVRGEAGDDDDRNGFSALGHCSGNCAECGGGCGEK